MKHPPWKKHLEPWQRTFTAHGLEFIVTNDPDRPDDGKARFGPVELRILKTAAGDKLPRELSELLHSVKRILGGDVVSCRLDRDP